MREFYDLTLLQGEPRTKPAAAGHDWVVRLGSDTGVEPLGRWKNFVAEWRARRAGARFTPRDIQRSAREVIGPTGDLMSGAWDRLAEGGDAYIESFDRRIPPSIFVSERDKQRHNRPIPLPERRIEAHRDDDGLTDQELQWGSERPHS